MMAVVMATGSPQSFRLFGARGALFTFNGSAGQANGLITALCRPPAPAVLPVMFSPSVFLCFVVVVF